MLIFLFIVASVIYLGTGCFSAAMLDFLTNREPDLADVLIVIFWPTLILVIPAIYLFAGIAKIVNFIYKETEEKRHES